MGKEYCVRDCERDGVCCVGYEVWGENFDDFNLYIECRIYQLMDFVIGFGYNWGGSIMRVVCCFGICGKCEFSLMFFFIFMIMIMSLVIVIFIFGIRDLNNNQCYNLGFSEIIIGWVGCDCCWDI